jgi:hypothetical protein
MSDPVFTTRADLASWAQAIAFKARMHPTAQLTALKKIRRVTADHSHLLADKETDK